MNKTKSVVILLTILLILLCCCLVVVLIGAGGYALWSVDSTSWVPTPVIKFFPTAEQDGYKDTPEDGTGVGNDDHDIIFPTAIPTVTQGAYETLENLKAEIVPINDARDLAMRLEGKENIPEILQEPPVVYEVGDESSFWVTDMDTNDQFQIEATLAYETSHSYFWIENGVNYNQNDLQALAETFENEIYPTDREFFGSEWSPGIDNDEHLYIVITGGMGYSIAGYFSSVDSIHPLAHEYSNAHETFMMNADNIGLNEIFTYGVLAHEFQHMIHWYQDRNETSWLNEGFSELASFLNGYYVSSFDTLYLFDPDIQLTDWPNDSNLTTPHYGASFLFVEYFLERFGEEATQQVVADADNGMDSIDGVLENISATDAVTGEPITADDVFGDWAVTNYVLDGSVGDGRYVYNNYADAQSVFDTEYYSDCPFDWQSREVQQYGVDYINLDCGNSFTLNFEGVNEVGVLPVNAYSGDFAFWSNKGDESDMTLTQLFDFTGVSGNIDLSYKVWYDLEEDYDYVYLEVSEDGQHWEIIQTDLTTDDDPSGNSYGWGYNGVSIEWMQEEVDISQYAGKQVYIRFEYVTDAAVNGEGFLLDDISIPQIGYQTDFESGSDGWEGEGFVRLQNRLPQTYRVSLIKYGQQTTVETLVLDQENTFSLPVTIGNGVDSAVLVVSGTTRFTRQPAIYRYSVTD